MNGISTAGPSAGPIASYGGATKMLTDKPAILKKFKDIKEITEAEQMQPQKPGEQQEQNPLEVGAQIDPNDPLRGAISNNLANKINNVPDPVKDTP